MLVGYDVHHKKRQNSLLAFCATMNNTLTKYWCKTAEQNEMEE